MRPYLTSASSASLVYRSGAAARFITV